jgi:hypothetical protein
MEFKDIIGKTIIDAVQMRYPVNDDNGFLRLSFTDNTSVIIVGDYNGYTGYSSDEYQTTISIQEDIPELIPLTDENEYMYDVNAVEVVDEIWTQKVYQEPTTTNNE